MTPVTRPVQDDAALRRSVRVLLTVADNVRRGALPPRVLHRMVAPQVAADILDELDRDSGRGVSEVRTVHLQQPTPTTTYFTGTARRPDDTAVAYLGLFSRDTEHDIWQVTQILPVNERTIGQPEQREVGAPPPRVEAFRDLITAGYLDPAIQLLGPIPFEHQGQRHDWLDAATTIKDHGEHHQLGPDVAGDLQTEPADPPETWQTARQIIDAYTTTYDVDTARYATFQTRMDTLQSRGRTADASWEIDR